MAGILNTSTVTLTLASAGWRAVMAALRLALRDEVLEEGSDLVGVGTVYIYMCGAHLRGLLRDRVVLAWNSSFQILDVRLLVESRRATIQRVA